MTWGIVASVGGALVGAGVSIYGANKQSDAINSATDAQLQASREQLELQREQWERAQEILDPYVRDGQRAQAYEDALLFGEGNFDPYAGGANGAPAGGPPDLSKYLSANTNGQARVDALAKYRTDFAAWAQANGINAAPPSLGMFGSDDNPAQRAERLAQYQQALSTWRQANPGTTPPGSSGRVTRDDVMRNIEDSPLARFALDDMRNRNHLADEAYNEENALSDTERTDNKRLADDFYGKRNDLAADARRGLRSVADGNYGAEYGLARTMDDRRLRDMKAARNGLRTVADDAYAGRMGEVDSDYAKRQDLTKSAVNAWEAKAADARGRAVDTATSRFGVTGQLGDARRGVADIEQQFAQDRAIYEAARNDDDWGWRSGQSLATRDARDDVYLGAEEGFNDDRRASTAAYDDARTRSLYRRGDAYTGAQEGYNNDRRDSVNAYSDDRFRINDTYFDRRNRTTNNRTARRDSAYDAFAGGRANAYGVYADALSGRSGRGFTAASGQASAGQTFANNASDAIGRGADAYASGQYGRAAVNDTLTGDLSRAAGDIIGSITNRPKKKATQYAWGG